MNFFYDDHTYEVEIVRKRMKRLIFRIDGNRILVSVPVRTSIAYINTSLKEVFPKLLPKIGLIAPIGPNSVYLLGTKHYLDGTENIENFGNAMLDTSGQIFIRKFRKYCLTYFESRVRYFEPIMGITSPYLIKIRDMTTRLGTNAKRKHSLTFALKLIHYLPEVIDSVIVHELSHHFEFNHSKAFYEVVYHYYPDYHYQHRRIKEMRFL